MMSKKMETFLLKQKLVTTVLIDHIMVIDTVITTIDGTETMEVIPMEDVEVAVAVAGDDLI